MLRLFLLLGGFLGLAGCLDEADIKFRSDRIDVHIIEDSSGRGEALAAWALQQELNLKDHPLLGSRRPVVFNRDGVVPSNCTGELNCRVSAPAGREFLDCAPLNKRGENEPTEFHYDGSKINDEELKELLHLYECIGVEYPASIVDDGPADQDHTGYGFYTIHAGDNLTPLFVVVDDPDAFVYPWGALYLYYHRGLNEICPEVDPKLWHPQGVELCPEPNDD